MKKTSRASALLAVVLSVGLTTACSGGSGPSSAPESTLSDVSSESIVSPEKVSQSLGVAYQAMAQSVAGFLSIEVDPADLEASQVASAAQMPRIRKDYDYFHLLMSVLDSDEQLGTGNRPSLAQLQELDSAMGQWLNVREAYLGDLSLCFGSASPAAFAECADPVFVRYETQLVSTAGDLGPAFEAVDNSGS